MGLIIVTLCAGFAVKAEKGLTGPAREVEGSMLRFPAEVSLGRTPYPKLHQVALLLVCLCISMVVAPGGAQHASDWVMVLCAVKHLEWSLRIQKVHIKTVHIPSTLEFG